MATNSGKMENKTNESRKKQEAPLLKDDPVPLIEDAVDTAKEALKEVEVEAKERAEPKLEEAIDGAIKALNDLGDKALVLGDKTAEIPVTALSETLVASNRAIERLKHAIKQYDEEHGVSSKVMEKVQPAIDKCSRAIAEISQHVSLAASDANAKLQGINSVIRDRVSTTVSGGLDFLLRCIAQLDIKYHIRDKAKETLEELDKQFAIQETAKSIDEKLQLSETAKDATEKLDSLSRGRLLESYEQGKQMAQEGFDFLQEEYDKAYIEKQREAMETELEAKRKNTA